MEENPIILEWHPLIEGNLLFFKEIHCFKGNPSVFEGNLLFESESIDIQKNVFYFSGKSCCLELNQVIFKTKSFDERTIIPKLSTPIVHKTMCVFNCL